MSAAASNSKQLSMRARNLDASRPCIVYYPGDIPEVAECAPISRAVHTLPSGMEKEEEQESHLQEAILARQHHTAGIAVENHVIPTPQVGASSTPWYQKTYPSREKPGNLIRLQGVFGFDEELPEYDLDSHDEEWLAKKPYIDPTEFEQIVQILEEHSSETEICQPSAAKSLLSKFDEVNANDVYDYWLQKRKINAENNRCPLILHLRTEPRISSTGNNHYIAFRKRAEKMQTRKNRKNDEETFEKILKLRHDMRKATTLFDMIRQRERTKFALLDVHEKTFAAKLELEELALQSAQESPKNAESVKVKSPRKRRKRLTIKSEYDPVTKSCLKKNDDAWNDIYSMSFDPTPAVPSTSTSDNSKAADITTNSELDGKYEFTRRKGCVYRSPLTLTRTGDGSLPEYCAPSRNQRFYETTVNGRKQFARVRVGRGGRRMLDVCENDSLNAPSVFGFSDPIFVDTSRSYRARTPRSDEEDGPSFVSEEGEEVARDEDSSEVEMSTYLDDSSLRRWVQKEPECFITVGTERRVPVVPVKSPESEKDFFQKPPTTTSRESAAVEEPMDYEHESSENVEIRPSLARLAHPQEANRELQVPALTTLGRVKPVPISCPISPSGSSVVATGSPPEQSVEIQSTKLSSANFDVVPSIKTFAVEEKSSDWSSTYVKFTEEA